MKYYIIAGEASGDLHGSNLMSALKVLNNETRFKGFGGDMMISRGLQATRHIRDLAFMGFTQVVKNLPTIIKNLSVCEKDILEFNPDAVILIDYPGFNLRIAAFCKKLKIPVIYYISPQIWAWKESRVHKIKKIVDKMIVILPFETSFYDRFDYQVEYVGHPLLDALDKRVEALSSKREYIALLPGSRKQEISAMLPVMIEATEPFRHKFKIGIAAAPSIPVDFYKSFITYPEIEVISANTYALLNSSIAALVTSGTATLETALLNVPQAVCYKANKISYMIAKKLIKVKYISLVNLIMDKEVIREKIQDDMNADDLTTELEMLINEPFRRNAVLNDYKELREKLGGTGASLRAAEIISKFTKGN